MISDNTAVTLDSEDDDTPLSQADDADLLIRAKAWFKLDRQHSAEWRENVKEEYDFVAGKQWSDEEKALLEEQNRPVITFNRILPTLKAVVGLEIGNRREVKYYPRSMGDAQVDDVLSAAADWCRDECDAEDEETDAFFDCIVGGMGWTDSRLDFEEDPEGKMVIERIDPLEMFWDCDASKKNLADARRLWRVRVMPMTEAKRLFPGIDEEDLSATWANGNGVKTDPHNADPQVAYLQGDQTRDKGEKSVTIVHLQWYEMEPYFKVADPFTGQMLEMDAAKHTMLQDRMKAIGGTVNSVKMQRKVFKQAFLGAVVLETGDAPCPENFSWQCMTGERDHNENTFFGLMRGMKDPQKWANKWLSQTMHIMNSQAKGGIMAEHGAFENIREAEDSYARGDKITWLAEGGAAKVVPKQVAQFPAGFDHMMQFAISSIRDVSGVNLELLGLRDATQPGVLEEHRKQAGMSILATLFDSLRRYRKRQGRVLLYYITNHLSDGRLIRIVGAEGAKYVPLIHQPGVTEYDVVVDDSPTAPNQKEKIWNSIVQMLPLLGKQIPMQDIWTLAKYSPLPGQLVDQLQASSKQAQEGAAQQAAQQQQVAQQILLQKHGSEMQQGTAKAAKDTAQAQKTTVEAQKEAMTPIVVPHPPMPPHPFGPQ